MKSKHLEMKRNRANVKLMLIVIAVMVVILFVFIESELYVSRHGLKVTRYQISSEKISVPFRAVQLTDLHNSVFGENNEKLTELVAEEKPDIILITGDLLNQDDENTEIAAGLIRKLSQIAPVYCSLGNHEAGYIARYHTDLISIYEEAGAEVLDYGYKDISVGSGTPQGTDHKAEIRIGGIYGYCLPEIYLSTGESDPKEVEFINSMADTEYFTLLMAHMPVCWMINGSLDLYDIDCVVSGHAHGGQIIIPFIGGFHAPDQGFFIGREWGVFDSRDGKKHLILSTGLGSNEKIPRFNNIPEIVVIDFENAVTE